MKKKVIFKRFLILLSAYLIFALFLVCASQRVERLNKIYHEKNLQTINGK